MLTTSNNKKELSLTYGKLSLIEKKIISSFSKENYKNTVMNNIGTIIALFYRY